MNSRANFRILSALLVYILCISTGLAEEDCNKLASYSKNKITEKYFRELAVNKFDNFFDLLREIEKGNEKCFSVGAAILKDPNRFGSNIEHLNYSFSIFADNRPEEFFRYAKKYALSDELYKAILEIPEWKLSQTRFREVNSIIEHRKKNVLRHLNNTILKNEILNGYEEIYREIKVSSQRESEYFYKNGVRFVYSSRLKNLVSDKEYPISNLSDGDKSTAWCVPYDSDLKWGYLRVGVDFSSLDEKQMQCNINEKNRKQCYVSKLILSFNPGYQKNINTFIENSRPKTIKISSSIDYYIGDVLKYDFGNNVLNVPVGDEEAMIVSSVEIKVDRWVSFDYKPITLKIEFPSVEEGGKYKEMCISDLLLDIISK